MPQNLPSLQDYDRIYRNHRATKPVASIDPLASELVKERDQEIRESLFVSASPDAVARATSLARQTGEAPMLVEDRPDEYEKSVRGHQFMGAVDKYPVLGHWAAKNPRGAAAASDDYDSLSALGKLWHGVKNTGASFKTGGMQGGLGAFDFFRSLEEFNQVMTYPIRGVLATVENAMFGTDVMNPDRNMRDSQRRYDEERAGREALINASRPQVTNPIARDLLAGVESIIPTLTAAATRSPVAGTAMLASTSGASAFQDGKAQGLSAPLAVLYGIEYGGAEFIGERIPMGRLVSDISNKTPFGQMLLRQLAAEVPGEQLTTVLQDMSDWTKLNPDKSVSEFVAERPGRAASTFLSTIAGVGGTTTLTQGAPRVAAGVKKVTTKLAEVRAARVEGRFFDNLGKTAKNSKLRGRDPEAFKDLMRSLGDDAGVEEVYLDGAAVREFLQSGELDPQSEEAAWLQRYEIEDAAVLDADVIIPVEDLSDIAGTPLYDRLKGRMRLNPAGMSAEESLSYEAAMEDVMDKLAGEALTDMDAMGPRESLFQSITTKLGNAGFRAIDARQQADLLTQRAVTRAARLNQPLTGAEFDKVTVSQILPKGLATAQKKDTLDIVIANMKSSKADPSKAARGPSLLEWIAERGGVEDRGGDLKAMGADKLKLRSISNRRKKLPLLREVLEGQSSMLGADGQQNSNSLDEVAMRAWEAGFFPEFQDRPDTNDLLEAIAEGIAGRDRFEDNEETNNMVEAGEQLAQVLDEMGLDWTASDAEIRAALDRYSDEQSGGGSRVVFQSDFPETVDVDGVERPTVNSKGQPLGKSPEAVQAFWRWFGESKVVDAAGRPLVVYHGTNQPVTEFSFERAGMATGKNAGAKLGFFFTSNELEAADYAENAGKVVVSNLVEFERKQGELESNYYRLEKIAKKSGKPEDFDAAAAAMSEWEDLEIGATREDASVGANVIAAYVALSSPEVIDFAGAHISSATDLDASLQAARGAGSDGVILRSINDSPKGGFTSDHYAAFAPEQIKSVNNVGTFDAADSRIFNQSKSSGNSAQTDLFSQDGSYEVEISAPEGRSEDREAESAEPRALSRDDAPAGNYAQQTEIVEENTRKLGASKVSSVEEAAQALAYLGRGAVERFDALVTDKDGKPLAIVGATKGGLSETSVFMPTLVGEAFRIEGAANIWFAHNHPSGRTELSQADRNISEVLATAFKGSGIKANKIFAIAGGVAGDPVWTYGDSDAAGDVSGVAKPITTDVTTPVVERVYSKMETLGPAMGSWKELKEGAPAISGGKPGIILANTANVPVAFVEIDPKEIGKLRTSGRMDSLYRAVSMANPGAAFIVDDGSMSAAAGSNLAGLLNSLDVSVHDIVTIKGDELTSWRGAGKGNPAQRTFKQGEKTPNGRILFPEADFDGTAVIELFEGRNPSTFLHEVGHLWLEELKADASRVDAPESLQKDFEAVTLWFKANGYDVNYWDSIPVEAHELWARSVERYLMEGKAPVRSLNRIFETFKGWLISVYRTVKALNAPITPEIREVMDRLLATDEEIAAAYQAQEMDKILDGIADLDMSTAEKEKYQDLTDDARAKAHSAMIDKTMRSVRRKRKEQYRSQVEALRPEVTERIDALPEFRALAAVSATPVDIDWVKETYGPEGPSLLPRRVPPVYKNGGTDPEVIASALGYTSADEMMLTLMGMEEQRIRRYAAGDKRTLRTAAIEEEIDRIIKERWGDPLNDGRVEEEAMAAIHNDIQGEVLSLELKVVGRSIGKRETAYSMAKDYARRKIREGEVRTTASRGAILRYQRAVEKSSRLAQDAMLTRNFEDVFRYKQAQMINNALASEAVKANEETEEAVRRMSRIARKKTMDGVDQDYLEEAQALLESVDLRQRSQVGINRQDSFEKWAEKRREEGFEIAVPNSFGKTIGKTNWTRLSVENLMGLDDTIKQIMHLGRHKQSLIDAADERRISKIAGEIYDRVFQTGNEREVPERTRNTPGAMFKSGFNTFLAMHRKMASLARQMDGSQDGGPMWENVIRPMNRQADMEAQMRADATRKLHEITKVPLSEGKMGGKGKYFPRLRMSLNREERIGIVLNMGNAGNLQRLIDGDQAFRGMSDLQPILDSMSKADMDMVQDIWDMFESYRPLIAAKERRVNGIEPDWIEPQPLKTPHGEYRGGYYPVKYDPKRSTKAQENDDAEAAKRQLSGSYTSATTRRSFTKQRAEAVMNRPLIYNLSGLYQGINEVIHDLSWHEWLINTNKILKNSLVDEGMRRYYGPEAIKVFKDGVMDIAAGDVGAQNIFEAGVNRVRMGATVAGLGWNVKTALLQPFGLTQSMVRIGPAWVARGLVSWFKAPFDQAKMINEKSAFMRNRSQTMQREINEIQNRITKGKTPLGEFVDQSFFIMIQKTQSTVDIPTWLGAYEKAYSEGNDEDRSIALADSAVRDAQGGGQVSDLAAIQRGGPLQKLFTNFYSFFSTTYNLSAESVGRTDFKKPADVMRLMMDYLLLYTVPSVMGFMLAEAFSVLRGDGDSGDDWVEALIAENLSFMFGTMVGVREMTSAVQKAVGVAQYTGSYGGPAGLRFFQELDRTGQQVGQGEADRALRKSLINSAGIIFMKPSGQINKTWDGVEALIDGDADNPAVLISGT